MQDLDDCIDKVNQLPPGPRILARLLPLLSQPDVDIEKVAELIKYDPSLTANVLHACNRAHLGAATPAGDLGEAIARLGFREVYRMVAGVSTGPALKPAQAGYGIENGELWKHSVTAAVAAQLIARDQGDDESIVFTGALLHDIGKLILSQSMEGSYAKLIVETEKNGCSLLEAEKKLLGVHHAEIGGRLLARWNFPENLVAAVWFHHEPTAATAHNRLAAFLYIGNMVAYCLGHGYGHQAFALRDDAACLELLELTPEDVQRYMIRTLENFQVVEDFLRIES
jgi:putative nucleotidyltransferase with HDIG domain